MSKDEQGWSLQCRRAASRDTEQGAEGGWMKLGRDKRALELFLWKARRIKHIGDEVALPPVELETWNCTVKNLVPIPWQQPEPIFLYQLWGILRSVLRKLAKPVYLAKPIYMMRSSCETGSHTFIIVNITCGVSETTALCSNPQRLWFKRVQRTQESALWHHTQGR